MILLTYLLDRHLYLHSAFLFAVDVMKPLAIKECHAIVMPNRFACSKLVTVHESESGFFFAVLILRQGKKMFISIFSLVLFISFFFRSTGKRFDVANGAIGCLVTGLCMMAFGGGRGGTGTQGTGDGDTGHF